MILSFQNAKEYQKTQQLLEEMNKFAKLTYTFSDADVDAKGAPERTGDYLVGKLQVK